MNKMKYSDEDWEYILHDTWSLNDYCDLMYSILQDKEDNWVEEFTLKECEMREIFKQIEGYWKDKVNLLLLEREELK